MQRNDDGLFIGMHPHQQPIITQGGSIHTNQETRQRSLERINQVGQSIV